jgi:two-component system OmpR family response regulator
MKRAKPITIFIVDDNAVFSLAMKADIETVFSNMLLNIRLFETGEQCMERFRAELPELVILDYNLNSKIKGAANGLEVLQIIKKVNPDCSVIMLTSEDNMDIAIRSMQHGASDYVVKTETQFRKINYSLLNSFKLMEVKDYKRKYKQSLVLLCVAIGAMAVAVFSYNYFSLA